MSKRVSSYRRATQILDYIGDAFYAVDDKWRFTLVNARAATLVGRSRQELLGKCIWEEFPQSKGGRFYEMHLKAVGQQQAIEFEMYWSAIGGWTRIFLHPTDNGGLAVSFRDIRQRKRVEEELVKAKLEAEEANAAKSRLLTIASHDLRQPLQHIIGATSLLERQALSPEAKPLLQRIEQAVDSLSYALDELRRAARLGAHELQPRHTAFPIAELFSEIADYWRPEAARKGLTLRTAIGAEIVESDPDMLKTIIGNLVSNGIKYTERGGVLLTCRKRGADMVIRVVDTGIGIPKAALGTIFTEFYRIDPTNGDGLGLGLSIVQKMADLLEHRITVRSRPGRGSVFEITLAAPARATPMPPPAEMPDAASA